MNPALLVQFEAKATSEGFSVAFSREVTRVLEYRDREARFEFTLDGSDRGNGWLTLEHHPKSSQRGPSYEIAFSRCRAYLEACGFQVEIFGA